MKGWGTSTAILPLHNFDNFTFLPLNKESLSSEITNTYAEMNANLSICLMCITLTIHLSGRYTCLN